MLIKEIYRLSILKLKKEGIATAQLDAQVLICFALKLNREQFYIDTKREVSPAEIKKINLIIQKRSQNIPVAYLTGHKEFFGLDFKVNKNVLIPRPESERLVEKSLEFLKLKVHKVKILDIGTGSGNIIISLTRHSELAPLGRWNLEFYGSDISSSALKVAKANAKIHSVDKKINFVKSDLFSNPKLQQKFDLIIANLPYVPEIDQDETSIKHEPTLAIFATENGADIIKRFLKAAPKYLNNNGMILIELDPRNANDLKKFAQQIFPKQKIRLEKDLAGFLRYLLVSRA